MEVMLRHNKKLLSTSMYCKSGIFNKCFNLVILAKKGPKSRNTKNTLFHFLMGCHCLTANFGNINPAENKKGTYHMYIDMLLARL